MSKITIRFLPHEKEIQIEPGTNLIRAAMEAGVHINASCGGEGVCGKCRVLVEQGEITGGGKDKLRPDDFEQGYRLACQSIVNEDIIVRVPVESAVDSAVLNMAATPRKTASIKEMNMEGLKEQGLFIPPVEKKYLELKEPSNMDNVCDMSRIINHLRQNEDEHGLEPKLRGLRKIPDVLRADNFKVTLTLERPVRKECGRTRIINIQSGNTSDRNFAIAIDVGTTTVYGEIVDCIKGKVLAQYGEFNKQISFGEDVISRIVFAGKAGGLEKLHDAVMETINKIIKRLIARSKVNMEDISAVALAGNTTMTQLFLKISPKHLRLSPYVPASCLYPRIRAVDIGLELGDHVTALVYPSISSYVGGDIVSGVMGSGMYRTEKTTLFMDIGTNAEIVIGNKDWMMCAACSAGPAFEGGGVEHGMRAAKGAIEDFSLDPITYEPMCLTIGNTRPKGICGSGLIIMVATMFEMGMINNSGKFDRDLNTGRIRERDGVFEYVLAWADETQINRDVVLTEVDIDNLIRAKGAMYAGCMTLLAEVGMDIESLDRIILAGGFGSYIDLESAMTIGLLPEVDPEKVVYVGNGSLLGARMTVLTNRLRQDVVDVIAKMTNFELSETPSYMDNYIAALFLPHTDTNLFPRLKGRMEARHEWRSKKSDT